jgi:hypothetical protein
MSYTDNNKEIKEAIVKLNNLFEANKEIFIDQLDHKADLSSALFKIKNSLERLIKNPKDLPEVIFDCFEISKPLTPYYSTDLGKSKIDPPLTNEEKLSFLEKLEKFQVTDEMKEKYKGTVNQGG